MSNLARDHRNADIAKIQIARKDLNLSDDVYRTILATQGNGASSSKDLDHDGRIRVLACFEKHYGWSPKKKSFTQTEMIEWLWRKLGQTGKLNDTSPAALMAFVGKSAGMQVTHLKFLPVPQASKTIEALKAWLKRAQKKEKPCQ